MFAQETVAVSQEAGRLVRPCMASGVKVRENSLIVKYYRPSHGTSFCMQFEPDEGKGFIGGKLIEEDVGRRLNSWALQPASTLWAFFEDAKDTSKAPVLRTCSVSARECRFDQDRFNRRQWSMHKASRAGGSGLSLGDQSERHLSSGMLFLIGLDSKEQLNEMWVTRKLLNETS